MAIGSILYFFCPNVREEQRNLAAEKEVAWANRKAGNFEGKRRSIRILRNQVIKSGAVWYRPNIQKAVTIPALEHPNRTEPIFRIRVSFLGKVTNAEADFADSR